jgi:hypothetical protein
LARKLNLSYFFQPPAGLLELATRPQAIERLQPELEIFCRRYSHLLQERFYGEMFIILHLLQVLVFAYKLTACAKVSD